MLLNSNIFIFILLCLFVMVNGSIHQILQSECGTAKLSETQFQNQIVFDLHFTSKYILIVSNYRLFRSIDDGATWEPYQFNETIRVIDIAVGSNTDFIVITGQNNHMWVSFDGGDTFTLKRTPGTGPLRGIQINPLNNSWIMGGHVEGDCSNNNRDDKECAFNLYITNDYGGTWRRLRTYIWMYYFSGDVRNPNRVVLWEDTVKERDQRDASESVVSVSVEPFFLRFKSMVRNVTGFLKVDDKIFAARPLDEGLGLYVSNDNGDSFRVAKTPSKLKGRRYTILDATPGSVFVNAQDPSGNTGRIYVSNEDGDDFSLSLAHNPRARYGACDFASVHGIQGVYLANTVSGSEQHTVITYSEGAQWERLYMKDCTSPPCTLNLYGNKDFKSYWFSSPRIPGLLIANGNIGNTLSTRVADMNTYASFNAGKSWELMKTGIHKFQVDETGSVLVLASTASAVNEISYSWDMGRYFTTCPLPGTGSVQIDYIIPVPGKRKFILFGRRSGHEIIISLDLSGQSVRTCLRPDAPDTFNSDYENWETEDCVNGRRVTYRRRRRNNVCVTPLSVKTSEPMSSEICKCTENDYQCTYCHTWNDRNKCVVDLEECPGYDPNQQPKVCNGYWYKTSGYRIIPGDTCSIEGGVHHQDTKVACT